jgi:DNA-binding NarL/FixJ family response regulator
MQPTTVLLIHPATFHWTTLHATLRGWPDFHIVDEVQRREPAVQVAAREQPDLIFAASDLPGVAPVPLVRALRDAGAQGQIIMIGKPLTPEEHRELADLDLAGFLQWPCVTDERLRNVIETVRDGAVRVGSAGAVHVAFTPERRRRARDGEGITLTGKERATLLGLTRDRTQQQIADDEGVSLRAIEDRVATLKHKFGVTTTFMLGVMAERLGFVP